MKVSRDSKDGGIRCGKLRISHGKKGESTMLEKSFLDVYDKFKLQFYRKVFEHVRERDGSLSAMEGFALEVIQILGEPTVSEFADFLNISQSNATYKVNNLIKKGYLERANSQVDRREYHLVLSEKYYSYLRMFTNYEQKVVQRMKERFSPEDARKLDEMFQIISNELMPECDEK